MDRQSGDGQREHKTQTSTTQNRHVAHGSATHRFVPRWEESGFLPSTGAGGMGWTQRVPRPLGMVQAKSRGTGAYRDWTERAVRPLGVLQLKAADGAGVVDWRSKEPRPLRGFQRSATGRGNGEGKVASGLGTRGAGVGVPMTPDQVAASGLAGTARPVPYKEEMEQGFGRDFSNVKAHMGPEAVHAARSLNARAYAMGDAVAFESTSPDRELVAHELAHVVQQSGGGEGVQSKSTAGGTSAWEAEADEAAKAVVSGRRAEVRSRVPQGAIQRWSGHEHRAMGNMAVLIATQASNFDVSDFKKKHGSKDFADPAAMGFTNGAEASPDPVLQDLENRSANVLDVETNDTYIQDPEGVGPPIVVRNHISFGAASEFGGDYDKNVSALANERNSDNPVGNDYVVVALNAKTNINHFFPLNHDEYYKHHKAALAAAQRGDRKQALLEEGFASHFLEDSFAAGHMAPRALDRNSLTELEEDELGLNRTKNWHDALNLVDSPEGLPTSRGGFHGDDTMTGNDLVTVATDVAASLREVLTTLEGHPEPANIQLPVPAYSEIMKSKYGPIWKRMTQDYEEDLEGAEKSEGTLKTDGGTESSTKDVASRIRSAVYGGQKARLLRLTNAEWNGAVLVFNLTLNGEPAPLVDPENKTRTAVWVQWFDQDMGYDHHASGQVQGTITSDAGGGFNDTDEKIGGPTRVTLADVGLGSVTAPVDDTGDTYAVFYADDKCSVPIGRSNVQGTGRGGKVEKPVEVTNFNWSGTQLTFQVSRDGKPASGQTLYLRWYDQDMGNDRDATGNLAQTIGDSDEQIGGTIAVTVKDGVGSTKVSDRTDDSGDTYATVYLDKACTIPLGRSPVQP